MIKKVRGINQKLKIAVMVMNENLVINEAMTTKQYLKDMKKAIETMKKEQLFNQPFDYIINNSEYNKLIELLKNGDAKAGLDLLLDII